MRHKLANEKFEGILAEPLPPLKYQGTGLLNYRATEESLHARIELLVTKALALADHYNIATNQNMAFGLVLLVAKLAESGGIAGFCEKRKSRGRKRVWTPQLLLELAADVESTMASKPSIRPARACSILAGNDKWRRRIRQIEKLPGSATPKSLGETLRRHYHEAKALQKSPILSGMTGDAWTRFAEQRPFWSPFTGDPGSGPGLLGKK